MSSSKRDPRKPCTLALHPLAILLLISTAQAAIVRQPTESEMHHDSDYPSRAMDKVATAESSWDYSAEDLDRDLDIVSSKKNHHVGTPPNRSIRSIASKFILLTTGIEIKLYPLHYSQDGQTILSASPYIVKTREAESTVLKDWSYNSDTLLKLTTWSREKQPPNVELHEGGKFALRAPDRRSSQGDQRGDIIHGQEQRRAEKVWISDVDYFFEPSFCSGEMPDNCLVVVWLDTLNNLVRFGSVDLAKNPVEFSTGDGTDLAGQAKNSILGTPNTARVSESRSEKSSGGRILWLDEQKPMDICKRAGGLDAALKQCQASGMFVDNLRGVLHISLAARRGLNGSSSDRILSGLLVNSNVNSVKNLRLLRFDNCPSLHGNNLNLRHFSSDLKVLPWIFYLDKRNQGKIVGLNLDDRFEIDPIGLAQQSLVLDISTSRLSKENISVRALTIDPVRHRLYWLLENSELYSCDYAGNQVELIEKLSPRPTIRAPDMMQVFQGTIFISDLAKNSIISYKLKTTTKNPAKHEQLRPTHQVLIVEMKPIQGFRLIDMLEILTEDTLDVDTSVTEKTSAAAAAEGWLSRLWKKVTLESRIADKSVDGQLIDKAKQKGSYCPALRAPVGKSPQVSRASSYSMELIWILCGLCLLSTWKVYTLLKRCSRIPKLDSTANYSNDEPVKLSA